MIALLNFDVLEIIFRQLDRKSQVNFVQTNRHFNNLFAKILLCDVIKEKDKKLNKYLQEFGPLSEDMEYSENSVDAPEPDYYDLAYNVAVYKSY